MGRMGQGAWLETRVTLPFSGWTISMERTVLTEPMVQVAQTELMGCPAQTVLTAQTDFQVLMEPMALMAQMATLRFSVWIILAARTEIMEPTVWTVLARLITTYYPIRQAF